MTDIRTASLGALATAAGDLVLETRGDAGVPITGVVYDSRKVKPGDLFFCVPGGTSDGHDFAPDAVAAGAAALCVERPLGLDVPEVVVSDARRAMARMGASFVGDPAADLLLIGITGTNGKTTTAYMIESILRAAGHSTGLIGTIETHIGSEIRPGVRTTPESLDLQMLFAEMVERGVDAVAMEVTSHALVLDRVEGVRYRSVGFTNLSQDHLDFHPSMDEYFAAKLSLFTPERAERGATNVDDEHGRQVLQYATIPCIGFGVTGKPAVRAERVNLRPTGTDFLLVADGPGIPGGEVKVSTSLVGAFNVSNCLAAAACALQVGIRLEAIAEGLRAISSIPGRFESIDAGQPFSVVVDYAHTPDSLVNVLNAARALVDATGGGRVLCVFGCGGDRDKTKRPLMGAAVARLADIAIVTSDNPRSEDPLTIIDEILVGVTRERPGGPDAVCPDRREAIAEAFGRAMPGDVVVIAGKGHETGQEFADVTIPFDDRIVAREQLQEVGYPA
jgi:UDP-N-acetylmuramoyl-L-alanyl-D-glutamate--2,6-diaminopimelate ligase